MDTLAKMPQNIFAYFSVSEHSTSFSKKNILVQARGLIPPPPSWSITNSFFTPSLSGHVTWNASQFRLSGPKQHPKSPKSQVPS